MICAVCALAAGPGCYSTIVPKQVTSSSISFDGNEQNGGLVGRDKGGRYIVTPQARERLNGLISRYGRKFIPPLEKDFGVEAGAPAGNYYISAESLVNFQTMTRWFKSGIP